MDLYEFLDIERIPSLWDTDAGKHAIKKMVKEAKKIAQEAFIEHEKKKLADAIADAIKSFNKSGVKIESIMYDGYKDKLICEFIEMKSHDGQFFYDSGCKCWNDR